MVEGRRKTFSAGEAVEAIFAYDSSNDETFDCGYDLDIIPYNDNERDSESSDSEK